MRADDLVVTAEGKYAIHITQCCDEEYRNDSPQITLFVFYRLKSAGKMLKSFRYRGKNKRVNPDKCSPRKFV